MMALEHDDHNPHTSAGALLTALDRSMAIIEFTLDGTIVSANDNYLRISGYMREELVGKNHKDLCPTEYIISDEYHQFWHRLRGGEHFAGLYCRKRKNGELFWVEATYNPVFSADGKVEKVVKFCTDVTARNEEAKERDDKLEVLNNSLLTAEYAPDGTFLSVNDNYTIAMGYLPEDIIGKNRSVMFSKKQRASSEYRQMWDSVCSGHSYSGQVERTGKSGSSVWMQAIYAPMFNLSGRLNKIVQFASDVTRRVQEEHLEHAASLRLSMAAESTDNAIVIADRTGKVAYVNSGFQKLLGYTVTELRDKLPTLVFGPQDKEVFARARRALSKGEAYHSEEVAFAKNGQRHWCAVTANRAESRSPENFSEEYMVFSYTDITDVKTHAVLQGLALEAMAHDVSRDETLNLICREIERILPEVAVAVSGLEPGKRLTLLAGPGLPDACASEVSSIPLMDTSSPQVQAVLWNRDVWAAGKRDDEEVVMAPGEDASQGIFLSASFQQAGYGSCWSFPLQDDNGGTPAVITFYYRGVRRPDDFQRRLASAMSSICSLALEREATRTSMRQLMFFDRLTGLPNRDLLMARGQQLLERRGSATSRLAILVCNLDGFKRINDSLGYDGGNRLLSHIGTKLQDLQKQGWIAGRLSGDEFALFVPLGAEDEVLNAAQRVQRLFGQSFTENGITVVPSTAIGVSMYPDNADTVESLLTHATTAMTKAKKNGVGQIGFFSADTDAFASKRLKMESHLRAAVASGGLRLFYQPQVKLQEGGLHGVESLCRWKDDEFGQVPPPVFIKLAEETGIIDDLMRWTLSEGCRQMGLWRKAGLQVPTVSINFSPTNFHDPNLVDRIMRELEINGLGPNDIILELTEGVLLDDNPRTMDTVLAASAIGLKFSMDDFGTGYSSLSYLRTLPISELKLDQSFVRDLDTNALSRRLSGAVVQISKSLQMIMVAEGVENEEQNGILREQGCHVVQGYYYSRPVPADEFERWYAAFAASGGRMR